MPELAYLTALMGLLRARLAALRADEQGSVTTEQVMVTAILAGLAIAAGAIIVDKVITRANNIPTQ